MSNFVRASVLLLSAFAGQALALDPAQAVTSYLRTRFTVEDGLPDSVVNVIVQTRNGFLWIATGGRLARFDGRQFTKIEFSPQVSTEVIARALAEGPDGDLWVATRTSVLRIPRAALDQFGPLPCTAYRVGDGVANGVSVLRFSRDGTLWAGGHGLYRLDGGAFTAVMPNANVSRIELALDDHLLVVTQRGLMEWNGAELVEHPELPGRLQVPPDRIYDVIEDHTGARWYCTAAGVAREKNGVIQRFSPYGIGKTYEAYRVLEDAQGNVWLNRAEGLFRAVNGGFEAAPDTHARYIYADRDGDLWLGTNGEGLVRLRNRSVQMYTIQDGLGSNAIMALLMASGGKLWVGANCGLSPFDGKRFRGFAAATGLTNACVYDLAEDSSQDIWAATWGGGAFRFHDGKFKQFSKAEGMPSDIVKRILRAHDGSLWFVTGAGIANMRNGQVRSYAPANGSASGDVSALYEDSRGILWATTSSGIQRLSGERFVNVAQVPGANLYRLLGEDTLGNMYAAAEPLGIFRMDGDRLISVTKELNVKAMVQFQGDLWLCGNGVFRAAADALRTWERERDAPPDYERFDRADGLDSTECNGLADGGDDTLWVATLRGVARMQVPPRRRDLERPLIYMEQIDVGQTQRAPGRKLVMPPGPHHVELHFGVVELASPEKIRMQYRLDDEEWLDAGPPASAIYSSFSVGTHQFHVRACNREGVWDKAGIVYDIEQLPYFYETKLFRFLVVATLGLLLAGGYRLRLRRLTVEMNARLDARVSERIRMARELHDTLLQTIHGSKMAADAGLEDPADTVRVYRSLERVSNWLAKAAEEGRAALTALRLSATQKNDLAEALERAGEDCTANRSMTFELAVEGTVRDMHPIVRDEVYRIAFEAMRNASSHSSGSRLSVELAYAHNLIVRVRDNGDGMDHEFLERGRAGHFGIRGMRERAERIGARLSFQSSSSGTEVELIVPRNLTFRGEELRPPRVLGKVRRFFRMTK